MKKRKPVKSKKRKPIKKPIKQLKRGTYRGTAEARKLKQKWMDSLQSMIGDIPIDSLEHQHGRDYIDISHLANQR